MCSFTERIEGVASASYNANNQLTQFGGASLAYDANGNLTSDGTNTYTWNARNQLVSISGGVAASFQYDAFGRRVSKTIGGTTQYVYDGANPVQEISGTTASANLLAGGVDEYFQRTDSAGARDYLTDALGSTLALADSAGAVQTSYTFEPFGNTTVSGASTTNSFAFTGRELDTPNLYFYRARYYSPTLQRFLSEDPLGYGGNSVNFYEYAYDNPANLIDPSGMQAIFIDPILLEDPITIDPNLLDQARQIAQPKQSLPMPDGGRIDLGPDSDPHFDKVSQQYIDPPHVHDPLPPYDAPYDNLPRGLARVPRPATNDDLIRAIEHNKPGLPVAPLGGNPLPGRKSVTVPVDPPDPWWQRLLNYFFLNPFEPPVPRCSGCA